MVNKCLNKISRVLEVLTVIAFVILIILILTQMFSRYLNIEGTGWTDEIISLTTTWMIFLGTSYLSERGEHISITLLEDRLIGSKQLILRVVIQLINVICALGIMYSGYIWILTTVGKKTPYLQINYNLWYPAILVFGIFFALFSIFKLVDTVRILFNNI